MVVLLVGVLVVVVVLVAGSSDAHELSNIIAKTKSSGVTVISCFIVCESGLIAGFRNDHPVNDHAVAFSKVVNANLRIFSDC